MRLNAIAAPSGAGPTVGRVRLRTLTEAECYARCYGERDERVSVLRDPSESTLRGLVEQRLARLETAELDATEQEAA